MRPRHPICLNRRVFVRHHGSVTIDHLMADSLDEMVAWCGKNTAVEDLVVLGITDLGNGKAAVAKLLDQRNITWIDTCGDMKGMTVQAASTKAALPRGGSLLAIFDCWEENYNPDVACSGFGDKMMAGTDGAGAGSAGGTRAHEYTCYNDSTTKSFPLNRMWSYLENVTAAGPPTDGQLYTHQAIWQETTSSVVVGVEHASSLLHDESRSGLNWLLTDRLSSGTWQSPRLGMLEVNNVCDGGLQLLKVLRALA